MTTLYTLTTDDNRLAVIHTQASQGDAALIVTEYDAHGDDAPWPDDAVPFSTGERARALATDCLGPDATEEEIARGADLLEKLADGAQRIILLPSAVEALTLLV